MGISTGAGAAPQRKLKGKRKKMPARTILSLYLLLAPTVILLFVFNYIPMYGIIISFENYSVYRGVFHSEWVGFEHFAYFLTDPSFWGVMRNTLLINFYDIVFGFTAPILFALLANEVFHKRFKKYMQTISYLPHFLSWVVVAGIFYSMLSPVDGIINYILGWFGVDPIYFMTDRHIFRGIIVFSDIWKSVGWSSILYFAVIAGIDTTLYEAAMIDGAGRFKQAIHITLPGMVPMIMLLLLLKIAAIFTIGFDRIYLLQNPLVYDVSDVISTYVYRIGLQEGQYGLTTGIGLMQNVMGFALLLGANSLSKKSTGLGLY